MTSTANDVSAVICTLNSISSIEQCLASLKASGIGQIVVVDANSTDGTKEIVEQLADVALTDPGTGHQSYRLRHIRNSTGPAVDGGPR